MARQPGVISRIIDSLTTLAGALLAGLYFAAVFVIPSLIGLLVDYHTLGLSRELLDATIIPDPWVAEWAYEAEDLEKAYKYSCRWLEDVDTSGERLDPSRLYVYYYSGLVGGYGVDLTYFEHVDESGASYYPLLVLVTSSRIANSMVSTDELLAKIQSRQFSSAPDSIRSAMFYFVALSEIRRAQWLITNNGGASGAKYVESAIDNLDRSIKLNPSCVYSKGMKLMVGYGRMSEHQVLDLAQDMKELLGRPSTVANAVMGCLCILQRADMCGRIDKTVCKADIAHYRPDRLPHYTESEWIAVQHDAIERWLSRVVNEKDQSVVREYSYVPTRIEL